LNGKTTFEIDGQFSIELPFGYYERKGYLLFEEEESSANSFP
tara:strand:+ start:390 stop:515 length:126 start_codon:yes stop_codon:yes gene_type:complete